MPLRQVLGIYWTWRKRFPSTRVRTVHARENWTPAPTPSNIHPSLAELVRKMQAGEDLTPHLSERVETAFISEQQRPSLPGHQRDNDHDRLLAAWGIHHLHLSSAPGPGRFNARAATSCTPCSSQTTPTCSASTPTATGLGKSSSRLPSATGPTPDSSCGPTTSWTRRRSSPMTTGGRFGELASTTSSRSTAPSTDPRASGWTAAGTSMAADRRAMAYMEGLRQLRDNLDERLSGYGQELDQAAGHPVTGDWMAHVHENKIGLLRGDEAFIGIPWLDVE